MKLRTITSDGFFFPQKKTWFGWVYFDADSGLAIFSSIDDCRSFLDEVNSGKRDKEGVIKANESEDKIYNYP